MIRLARRVICCIMIVSVVRCISVVVGNPCYAEEKDLFRGMQTELAACWDLNTTGQYLQENLPKLRNAVHQTLEKTRMDIGELSRYAKWICNYLADG